MSATLGPSWNLRSNSSPRCLIAYIAKTKTSEPNGGGGGDASNPFDDELRPSWSVDGAHGVASRSSGSSVFAFSVAFGTERGSLHYREYPSGGDAYDDVGVSSGGGVGRRMASHERSRDTSQLCIDPKTPINLQGAVKGSIVGIVCARTSSPNDTTGTSAIGAGENEHNETSPVFLLLVDDNRGSSSAQSSNPGAFAAHLVTMKHGTFGKLPAAPASATFGASGILSTGGESGHWQVDGGGGTDRPPPSHKRGGSKSGSGGMSGWFGSESGGADKSTSQMMGAQLSTSNPATAASLGTLPRMSCATYHPNTGYVYAAGTGIHGLAPTAVKAVLAGMMLHETHPSGGRGKHVPFHHLSNTSVSSSSQAIRQRQGHKTTHSTPQPPVAVYLKCNNALPQPGVRCSSGGGSKNAMTLACSGRVAIVAVTNAFYAVPSCLDLNAIRSYCMEESYSGVSMGGAVPSSLPNVVATKLMAFAQSSQVHPVIAMEVMASTDRSSTGTSGINDVSLDMARWLKQVTSLVVLASGRACTAVEVTSIPDACAVSMLGKGGSVSVSGIVSTSIKSTAPRHGIATFPSPILAAAPLPPIARGIRGDSVGKGGNGGDLTSGPLIALLTVDGLVHIRSPFCIAVALTSIEVGTRPNDFFSLSSLASLRNDGLRQIVATSYGGESRLISCHEENSQEFADRLIKMSIDAFGVNGFPRLELADALGATFSATSYVGPEPTTLKRSLIREYLESMLGLSDDIRLFMGKNGNVLAVSDDGLDLVNSTPEGSALESNALLTCTALLCLVCFQLSPPNATLASRGSKACASQMGIVRPKDSSISKAAIAVCELIADRLLKEASASFSLLNASSPAPISSVISKNGASMEFVESAVWLLRSCGCHEKAILVLSERMNNPALRNASIVSSGIPSASSGGSGWPQIKYDSYFATHLGELWSSRDDACCQLVLSSSATRDLIARNPTLGLSIFTTPHPQNTKEWRKVKPGDDPLSHPVYPSKVVELLKSVTTTVGKYEFSNIGERSPLESLGANSVGQSDSGPLPLQSGRALAVTYLESAIGIATGRPSQSGETSFHPECQSDSDERKADMHDELSYLLLEGVISERGDGDDGEDSDLGAIYRYKLRRLLSWPNSMIRSERLLASLPSSFLREHALLLGRMGRHEDALRIFYSDLSSLELALEYCDVRHEMEPKNLPRECSYLPLVKVALNSDPDSDRGIAAAIQVLALRRDAIDKSAALRLLPKDVPMSAVARPFLIPAVVENESQVRRLTVAASLLRSRYVQLKQKLTEAQLKSNASLHSPALQKLNLGEPLRSSKPFKARPVHAHSSGPNFPDVMLVKHFFPRHLVIQAKVMNTASNANTRTLSDVAFVVAESSDEAILPTMEVPLKTLPCNAVGSAWCVMAASPQRLDGTVFLTCELRYTVLSMDATTGAPLNFNEGASNSGFGRTYVEELQDIEIRHTDFSS